MNVITGWPPWQGNRRSPSRRTGPWRLGLVVLLLAAVASPRAVSPLRAQDAFLWPLETRPKAITGTFMEARSAHYHSGLDVKTGGRIGLRLLAPAAGWISRVRVSPEGYGKAIYLRTADGSTLVFAHLSALADSLQARITRAQARRGRYPQDLRLDPDQITVQRGELLGLTGATGTGAPHLHLEVRSPDGLPTNPLTHGFTVPDERSPQLRRWKLLPAEEAARIAGRAVERVVSPGETIEAAGLLQVQVDVVDKTGIYDHSLMPLGLALFLDGAPVYAVEQDRFDFAQGRQMRLEMAPDRVPGRRPWFRMYRRPGNDLPSREDTRAGATCRIPRDGEKHRLTLRGWDAAGNVDSVGIWIVGAAPAALPPSVRPPAGGVARAAPTGEWSLELTLGETMAEILATTSSSRAPSELAQLAVDVWPPGAERPVPVPISLLEDGTGVCAAVELTRLDTGTNRFRLTQGGGEAGPEVLAEVIRTLLIPGLPLEGVTLAPGGPVLGDASGRVLFPGGALWVEPSSQKLTPPRGTSAVGSAWMIRGVGLAFRGAIDVELRLDATEDDPVGLFRVDGRGRYSWLGAERSTRDEAGQAASYLRGELGRLGTVVALRDAHPPYLGEFQVAGRTLAGGPSVLHPVQQRQVRGVTLPRWPVIELPIADAGAGLDVEGVVSELNGRPYPARWDPEEERIYFELYVDPGAGAHRLRVEATDRLGNRSEKSLEFELREL